MAGLALWAAASAPAPRAPGSGAPFPAIVFVARQPVEAGQIPGLGPHGRAASAGGRLMIRERDGRVRTLLPPDAFFDVSDPAISFDARRVAFAAKRTRETGWRIWLADLDGSHVRPLEREEAGEEDPAQRSNSRIASRRSSAPVRDFQDLDPAWVTPDLLCFASTREGGRAQYARVPVTNLWLVRTDGTGRRRITAERGGAEEPALDPRTGHLVYARWWFNRFQAAAEGGITATPARALPGDRVNLWHAIEISADAAVFRLAAGEIGSRRGSTIYQPAIDARGAVAGVYALHLGFAPAPGGTGVHAFARRYGAATRIAGPIVPDVGSVPYGTPRGLAAPSACAPAWLPGGGLVFAYDPGARGDFRLAFADRNGAEITTLVDLPGTLELDPAPVVARPVPPGARAWERVPAVTAGAATFTYSSRNLFAGGAVDSPVPDGPAPAPGLTLVVYGAHTTMGSDRAELLRRAPLDSAGAVRIEGLPAGRPLFEQLVDAHGRAVPTAHGPAHVAGFNFGRGGATSRCIGCHLGHSILDASAADVSWSNAAPAARVTASSHAAGTRGASAATDRRTRGAATEVAWIAGGAVPQRLTLAWDSPLEIGALVLHAPRGDRAGGTDATIDGCTITLMHHGREVARRTVSRRVSEGGTRVPLGPVVADQAVIEVTATRGRVAGRAAAALAEVEVEARLPRRAR